MNKKYGSKFNVVDIRINKKVKFIMVKRENDDDDNGDDDYIKTDE